MEAFKLSTVTGRVYTSEVTAQKLEDIAKIVQTQDWAPGTFQNNYRLNKNFQQTSIMPLDVDDGLSLADALEIFKDYKHIIATSKSHQKVKHPGEPSEQPACDRFRVLLFTSKPILEAQIYQSTWNELFRKFPFADKACKDPARFFHPSPGLVSVNSVGKLIEPQSQPPSSQKFHPRVLTNSQMTASMPVIKSNLSLFTKNFINHGARPGEWSNALYKVARDFNQQGYTKAECILQLSKMENDYFMGTLDEADLRTINSAFSKSPTHPPRIPEVMINFPQTTARAKLGAVISVPVPNHPDNLKYLLSEILQTKPELNLLKNRAYIAGKPFNDQDLSFIRNRCREFGLSDSKDFVMDVIVELAKENQYHPFLRTLDSVRWDGQDYIRDLFETITVSEEAKDFSEWYYQYLKRFLIGVVAKVRRPGSQNLVLTFLAKQGAGKGRWLEKLFSVGDELYGEGPIDPSNKDHQLLHLNYLGWHIPEIDGSMRKSDAAALKGYLTASSFAIREPFKQFDRVAKSVLSFCASVNSKNFLVDETGSRRYLVMDIEKLDHCHNVDIYQVWAQALHLYNQGEQYWFDEGEIKRINELNESYQTQNYIDEIASHVEPGDDLLSGVEIFTKFYGKPTPQNGELQKLGILLKRKGIQGKQYKVNQTKVTKYSIKAPSKPII